jgi:hypothetical protein
MFKFILILLIVFFVFGKIIKYAFRYWVMTTLQKQQQYSYKQPKTDSRKEGSIHIDINPKSNSKKNGDYSGGEYVDYEVVK